MSDLVQRLRDSVRACRALDRSALLAEAADEIERLRLTDAEREAVEAAARIIDAYDDDMDGFSSGAAATLRGLLERMK